MLIQRFDRRELVATCDIHCQYLFGEDAMATPFASSWCVVPPGGTSRSHNHWEIETFFIARGSGRLVRADGEEVEVGPGDVLTFEAFEDHSLHNLSADDELVFLSVVWEDPEALARRRRDAEERSPADDTAPTLVFGSPPTPNGDLHLGHLTGPYLGADILARALRLRGVEAHYVLGEDLHQTWTLAKAREEGEEPLRVAERMTRQEIETLEALGVELAHYVHPAASKLYTETVQGFFRKLWDDGELEARETPAPYCESCDRYLYEIYVRGSCPRCGETTYGNACEGCSYPNDCTDLGDPHCVACDVPVSWRTWKRLFFPLGRHAAELSRHLRSVDMSTHHRALCEELLAEGLPDVSISHVADWGIPVPVEGFEGQVLNVWCEMAPGYLAAARELHERLGGDGEGGFFVDPGTRVVQFFGVDNGLYHALVHAGLFLAHGGLEPPAAYVMNHFYRLDGSKFSTSRGHVVWGRDLVREADADLVRFYLAHTRPETEATNFTREQFERTVREEILETWCGWLRELSERLGSERGGEIPGTGLWTDEQRRFYEELQDLVAEVGQAYSAATFSTQNATRALGRLVRRARRFAHAEASWRRVAERADERRTGLALEALAAKLLAILSAPILPGFAERLWSELGCDGSPAWETPPEFLPAGQRVALAPEEYFASLDPALTGAV